MRQLEIDLGELEIAFDTGGEMRSYYLDLETGEVIMVTDEDNRLLERIYASYYDEQSETVDWEKAFEQEPVPDWQREPIKNAHRVEAGYSDRFVSVPSADSREGYRDMEVFIATVGDPRLQERLGWAIDGSGAFRRFKDVLLDHPAERERWFQFKGERLHQRILDWLAVQGITPLQRA